VKEKQDHGFPARDAIVAFIRSNPGKVGTREIARQFGLKNTDRVELKRMLRELADDGTIAKRGRKIHRDAHRVGYGRERRRTENPHRHAAPSEARHHRRDRRPCAAAHRDD
jgi:hypothetical protein